MKCLLVIISFLSLQAQATPIVHAGVGTATPFAVTILPDNADPNLFYFFPSHYGLTTVGDHKAFTCMENDSVGVQCNMIFEASIAPQTVAKINEIRAANPNAKFSPVPYTKMALDVSQNTHPYLRSLRCQKNGSETGQQVACEWQVRSSKYKAFRTMIMANALVEVMLYNAKFIAITGAGQEEVPYTIPMYATELGKGDYFFDSSGNVIH